MSNLSFLGFINKRLRKLAGDVVLDDSDLEFTDEEDLLDEEYEDDFKPLKEVGGKSETEEEPEAVDLAEEELETAGTAEDEFEVEEEFEAEDEFETVYSAAGEPKAKGSDDIPAFLKPEPQVGKAGSISPAKKTTSSINKDPRLFNSFLERENVKWEKIIYFPPQKAYKSKNHVFTIKVDNQLLNHTSYEYYQNGLKEALQGVLDFGGNIEVTLTPSNEISIVIPGDVNIAPLMKRLEKSNIEFETCVFEEPRNKDDKKGAIEADITKKDTPFGAHTFAARQMPKEGISEKLNLVHLEPFFSREDLKWESIKINHKGSYSNATIKFKSDISDWDDEKIDGYVQDLADALSDTEETPVNVEISEDGKLIIDCPELGNVEFLRNAFKQKGLNVEPDEYTYDPYSAEKDPVLQARIKAAKESIAKKAKDYLSEITLLGEDPPAVEEEATKTAKTSEPESDTPSEEKKEEQKVEKLKAKKSTEQAKVEKPTEEPKEKKSVEKIVKEAEAKKTDGRAPIVYTNRSYFGTASGTKNNPTNSQIEGSNTPKEERQPKEEKQNPTVSTNDLGRQASGEFLRPGTTGFFNTSRTSKKSIDK